MPSGEDDLIAQYFKPLATDAGALGLVDDAAVLAASSDDLVLTTDAVVGRDVLQGRLKDLAPDHQAFLIDRYRQPQPRSALAVAVRDHAGAAMDVSDGLAGDLAKMCAASGVSAVIDAAAVPLRRLGQAGLARLLSGGDDYEILCGVAAEAIDSFKVAAAAAGVPVTVIGTATEGAAPPQFLDSDQHPIALNHTSFSHF